MQPCYSRVAKKGASIETLQFNERQTVKVGSKANLISDLGQTLDFVAQYCPYCKLDSLLLLRTLPKALNLNKLYFHKKSIRKQFV